MLYQLQGEKLDDEELKESILSLQKSGEIGIYDKYGVDEYLHITGKYIYVISERRFDKEIDL